MKRAALALLPIAVVLLFAGPAWADGTINWTGNGSDNLPCESGGHWVLAPAFGIDSATLHVDGSAYVMSQSGQGSWSADSSGSITEQTDAFVTYTGDGDERDHLQLSHCLDGTPTETPPPTTPPPTTPPPTTSTPPPTTHTETPPPPPSHVTFCVEHPKDASCQQPTAFTGSNTVPVALAGLGLLLGGSLLMRLSRRKGEL